MRILLYITDYFNNTFHIRTKIIYLMSVITNFYFILFLFFFFFFGNVGLLQVFTVGIDQFVYVRVQPPRTSVLTLATTGANTRNKRVNFQ